MTAPESQNGTEIQTLSRTGLARRITRSFLRHVRAFFVAPHIGYSLDDPALRDRAVPAFADDPLDLVAKNPAFDHLPLERCSLHSVDVSDYLARLFLVVGIHQPLSHQYNSTTA